MDFYSSKSLSAPNLWVNLSLLLQSLSVPNLWVNIRNSFAAVMLAMLCQITSAAETSSLPVTIRVDASRALGPLRPIWRFFGGDEPNYATMKDGQKLLAEFGKLRPKDVYCRTHNLLNSGDGTPALKWGSTDAYRESAQDDPLYNWTGI